MSQADAYGARTLELIDEVRDGGVAQFALLMRHSAREFNPDVHDLVNPLTDEGRELCRQLGAALPRDLVVRGYASPPERCVETAEIVIGTHEANGSSTIPVRPVESLGVFYALDQVKFWKGMQIAGGMGPYMHEWVNGQVPLDAMIPAHLASRLLVRSILHRLRTAKSANHLDLCVSHDLSLLLVRHSLLEQPEEVGEVRFLDALALYERDGEVWLQSHHGAPRQITAALDEV